MPDNKAALEKLALDAVFTQGQAANLAMRLFYAAKETKMKLYNCKVRLHGDVRDECRKKNVTSGEIRLLQQIHGEDAVSEVTPTGAAASSLDPENKGAIRSEAEERDRLTSVYGEKEVNRLFGVKQASIDSELDAPSPKTVAAHKRLGLGKEELIA